MELFIEISIIVGLLVLLALTILLIIRTNKSINVTNNISKQEMDESINNSSRGTVASIVNANNEISNKINKDFSDLLLMLESKIKTINDSINDSVKTNFKDTNETIKSFQERILGIESAQKQLNELSSNILQLEKILGDNKQTGNFGEELLENLLYSYYGEEKKLYEIQYCFDVNGDKRTPDSVIFLPKEILCIDSKFPLHFYKEYLDSNNENKEQSLINLKDSIKKQIKEISSKYIVDGITCEYAVMFIPSDSLLSLIHNKLDEIVELSKKSKVLLLSPSTLIAFISNIKSIKLEYERNLNAKGLYNALNELSLEFARFVNRYKSYSDKIKQLYESSEELNITTEKITKKFDNIKNMDFDKEDK